MLRLELFRVRFHVSQHVPLPRVSIRKIFIRKDLTFARSRNTLIP
jgi:hypothetical protein